jgi:hypothetical protein
MGFCQGSHGLWLGMANFRRTKLSGHGHDPRKEVESPGCELAPTRSRSVSLSEATTPSETHTPWMTVVDAARYAGFPCTNGRAPNSFYDIANAIGYRLHGRWLIARADLDAYIRGERRLGDSP